ncbi:MAG: hypothetical protein LBV17_09210 [Treponema sp.]|jgi:hypothetical protein|nr:hypothetical protein [Treponema sp.]
MLKIIDHSNINCNKIWGPEYILMDSQKFMGGFSGPEYDNVIDMLINIWHLNRQPHPSMPFLQA